VNGYAAPTNGAGPATSPLETDTTVAEQELMRRAETLATEATVAELAALREAEDEAEPEPGPPEPEPEVLEPEPVEPEPEALQPEPEPVEPEPEPPPALMFDHKQKPGSDHGPSAGARPTLPAEQLSLAERSRVRRRIRYLRKLREVQLRDLGGFLLELHRLGRERSDLVRAKLERAADTDRELRGLEMTLDGTHALGEVRVTGIGGACEHCGAVHGSADRFCASCGRPLARGNRDESGT
jgi:hypothetical protein